MERPDDHLWESFQTFGNSEIVWIGLPRETRVFTDMDQWIEVRRCVLNGELSKRAACVEYGIHGDMLTKILTHSDPPGYRLTKPRPSKLALALLPPSSIGGQGCFHEILEKAPNAHRKQRHIGMPLECLPQTDPLVMRV